MNAHPTELVSAQRTGISPVPPDVLVAEPVRAFLERLPSHDKLPKAPDGTPIRATYSERHEGFRVVVEIFAATFMDCARGCARYVRGRPTASYGTKYEVIEQRPDGLFAAWGTRNAIEHWN
jgi:hypothetical protein